MERIRSGAFCRELSGKVMHLNVVGFLSTADWIALSVFVLIVQWFGWLAFFRRK